MDILDQALLRELENKCTQEQPPAAMAACPLHVDCRSLCAAVSAGDFDSARAIYEKSVPFPELLAEVCDAPCGRSCVRDGLGGPIDLRALEKAAMTFGKPGPKRLRPTKKIGRVAVAGDGLFALTVEKELVKKGYEVTLFDEYAERDGFDAAFDATGGPISPVFAMAEGKSAAVTLDRQIKNVSLTAGREREGVHETLLYVETKNVDPRPAAEDRESREGASAEAGRCLDCKCMECAKSCAFISHFKSYPKKYVRETYNNLSIAMGNHTSNILINSCALCSQCAAVCPNGLDLVEVMQSARQIMVKNEKMPASAFDFAIKDMLHANGDSCFLARNQRGYETSKYLFFPSCQLGASAPEVIRKAYSHLSEALDGGVGLLLGCCGIMARWAGQEELYDRTRKKLLDEWEALGKPQIITACPTCRKTLGGDFGDVTDIWTLLLDIGLPAQRTAAGSYTIHDACGARGERSSREDVRRLLGLMGCEITEPEYSGELAPCCGYGGLVQFSNSEVADEMTRLCTRDVDKTRLTYCMNCRDRFAKSGARAVHVLELIYGGENAETRAAPGYSLRRDNREGVRRGLMEEFWNEKQEEPERLSLIYDAEVAELLENRLILEQDLRRVMSGALETGSFIREAKTGLMIASGRIGNVTFWVYFKQENDVWRVCRAYSHRMEVKQG